LGFEFRRGLRISLFDPMSRPALGPTHPPIQWLPVAFTPVIKRPGLEA